MIGNRSNACSSLFNRYALSCGSQLINAQLSTCWQMSLLILFHYFVLRALDDLNRTSITKAARRGEASRSRFCWLARVWCRIHACSRRSLFCSSSSALLNRGLAGAPSAPAASKRRSEPIPAVETTRRCNWQLAISFVPCSSLLALSSLLFASIGYDPVSHFSACHVLRGFEFPRFSPRPFNSELNDQQLLTDNN